MKIRLTVAFSRGVLSGMAKNDPNAKATSMLCVMSKCLYRGPSIMMSVTPVHKLPAALQFEVVRQAATVVEQAESIVLGPSRTTIRSTSSTARRLTVRQSLIAQPLVLIPRMAQVVGTYCLTQCTYSRA